MLGRALQAARSKRPFEPFSVHRRQTAEGGQAMRSQPIFRLVVVLSLAGAVQVGMTGMAAAQMGPARHYAEGGGSSPSPKFNTPPGTVFYSQTDIEREYERRIDRFVQRRGRELLRDPSFLKLKIDRTAPGYRQRLND
jgi:hypothetical protein